MNILYITNARIPTDKGHGVNIVNTCLNLAEIGVNVNLLVPKRKNSIKKSVFEYYGIENKFSIKYLPTLDFFSYESFLGKFSYWVQLLSFYFLAFFHTVFISRKKIIYSRDVFAFVFRLLGFKVFYECHSIPNKKDIFFRLSKLMTGIIVISNGLMESFTKRGIPKEKIFLAPDAVDLKKFDIKTSKEEARRKLKLPLDKKIIGYCGKFKTMGMDKGIEDILKSLQYLDNDVLFYAIGGSKVDIDYYKKIAESQKVKNRVFFIGHVSQNDLAVYQKAFDILLMPFPNKKHYAEFMSPIKMFEYMASKRPIVASDLPTIREVLNGKNSMICEPDNPKDLSKKISILLDNEKISNQLAYQAFLDAQDFTWNKRAEKILNYFKI